MKSIEEIREAFMRIHRLACGTSDRAYMSVPADPNRDADLIVSAAIDELRALRVRCALLEGDLLDLRRGRETMAHTIASLEHQVKQLADPLVLEQLRRPPPPIIVKVVGRDLVQEGRDL